MKTRMTEVFGVKYPIMLAGMAYVSLPKLVAAVSEAGLQSGVVTLFVPHTTAAVTINENADPSVAQDILKGLMELVPRAAEYYRHLEGKPRRVYFGGSRLQQR